MHLGQPLLLSLIFIPADTVPILAEGSYVAAGRDRDGGDGDGEGVMAPLRSS